MSRRIKSIIFTLCIVILYIIECVKTNGNYEIAAIMVNCTGFCIFPFVLSRFELKDFLKWPYAVYAVAGGVFVPVAYFLWADLDIFPLRILVAELNVYLYGFIIVRLFIMYFIEYRAVQDRKMSIVFYLWLVMMLFCVVSVNKTVWPLWFTMMFGTYYLTPVKGKDLDDMFESFVNGLIIAFFIIQSLAFLYRPYEYSRYKGFFFNSNINGLFYLVSYVAVLVKLHLIYAKKRSKILYSLFFALACSMWSFMMFSASRCSALGFVAVTVAYLCIEEFIYKKRRIKGFLISGGVMFFIFLLSLYPVYACVRYIPQLRHHPVFFLDEYNSKDAITSEMINDDEAYVSFKDSFRIMTGRFNTQKNKEYWTRRDSDSLKDESEEQIAKGYFKEISYGPFGGIIGIRKYIWLYYFQNIHFFGAEESFENVWITANHTTNHPNNSFIFMLYGYGIIPGILFALWIFITPVYIFLRYRKQKDSLTWHYLFTALCFLAFICFGFFETASYPGRTIFVLLFLTYILFMKKKSPEYPQDI